MQFASPNAVSSLHRMGIHAYAQGAHLADIGFDDDAAAQRDAPRTCRSPRRSSATTSSMLLRVLPLLEDERAGRRARC